MVSIPALTPVIVPIVPPAVATDELLLLQVPPPASVNVVVRPLQTTGVPEIAAGMGVTVKVTALPLDGLEEQPDEFVTDVIVNVVDPVPEKAGDVNVPLPEAIVTVAVLPVAVFAPLRLYVTV